MNAGKCIADVVSIARLWWRLPYCDSKGHLSNKSFSPHVHITLSTSPYMGIWWPRRFPASRADWVWQLTSDTPKLGTNHFSWISPFVATIHSQEMRSINWDTGNRQGKDKKLLGMIKIKSKECSKWEYGRICCSICYCLWWTLSDNM